jgi:antitoxin HicB
MNKKSIKYYMDLPYSIVIKKMNDESGQYYYAQVAELDGCQSHGSTEAEALSNIREALKGYLETKLEFGDPIPEPKQNFSGRIVLRMPKTLHQQLAEQAELEGVSLNQYMLYKLSKSN